MKLKKLFFVACNLFGHRQAPHNPCAQGPAHPGGIGSEGLQREHLARPVRAQGHACRCAKEDQRSPQDRSEGPRVHQEAGSPGRRGRDRQAHRRP